MTDANDLRLGLRTDRNDLRSATSFCWGDELFRANDCRSLVSIEVTTRQAAFFREEERENKLLCAPA